MRGLTSLALVVSGGLAAAYGIYPTPAERQAALDGVAATAQRWVSPSGAVAPSDPRAASDRSAVVDPQRRVFSPQAPLFQPQGLPQGAAPGAQTIPPAETAADASAQAAGVRTAELDRAQARAQADAPTAPAAALVEPAAAASRGAAQPLPRAGSEEAQRELARSLQKELKRVGCYDGEINGTWNAAARRAMKMFTDRVNATLPVDQPDYILLTLVQGHAATACGAPCPSSQVQAGDGRCLPRAIVAQAEKSEARKAGRAKAAQQQDGRSDTAGEKTLAASSSAGSDGRVRSASRPEPVRAAPPRIDQAPPVTASSAGWRTTTVAAAPSAAAVPSPAPVAISAPAAAPPPAVVAPLPGRMAIGGPVAATPPADHGVTGAASAQPPRPPRAVVGETRRARPARPRAAYADPGYGSRPAASKSSRVRNMHYNLFNNPTRTTN